MSTLHTNQIEISKKVLEILVKARSMPFLELASVAAIDEKELQQIIDDLEKRNFVKVSDRGNVLDEIVLAREAALAATL